MRKAAVIGWPVRHSLSPKLHNYWLKHYGIEGSYEALEIKPEDLKQTLAGLKEKGFSGVNLTLPHKEAAFTLVDVWDEAAQAIGAVNAIVVLKDGSLMGKNTDVYGFAENIRPHVKRKNKAVILGAGGAAAAVCKALLDFGFSDIAISNRTYDKAEMLAKRFTPLHASPWNERHALLKDADLLVNTTSLGMVGKEALDIDLSALPKSALVTDIVYTPLMTPLLLAAQARGNTVVDGLGMLLHQASPAFEAWFGVKPEVTAALRSHMLGGL